MVKDIQHVGKYCLKNSAPVVCAMRFKYESTDGKWIETANTGNFIEGQSKTVDPNDLSVPDLVKLCLHVDIKMGRDEEATEYFIYEKGLLVKACYKLTGPIDSTKLDRTGLGNCECDA